MSTLGPLDVECYACGALVGAACTRPCGDKYRQAIVPHAVRVETARRGELTHAMKWRTTRKKNRALGKSRRGKFVP